MRMRNKSEYLEYLNLKTEKRFLGESLRELDEQRNELSQDIRGISEKLKKYKDYEDITSEEARELMSSVVFESVDRPMVFRGGGSLELPIDSFCKCSDYKEFTPFQKSEFKRIQPELSECQLGLQNSLITAGEIIPHYSVDECRGVAKWCDNILRKHPNYQDLTEEQEEEIREIIYKFAKHTIE